jgi:hypothetical protein
MEHIFDTTIRFLKKMIEVMLLLLIVGIIVGLLYPHSRVNILPSIIFFSRSIGSNGMAGVLALFLIGAMFWGKK